MESTTSGPAYRITTPRLVVRCWQPSDAQQLHEAVNDSLDHLLPWMPWAHSEPEEIGVKVDRLRRFRGMFDLDQDFIYAIFNSDESRVIGGTGLHPRLGAGAREIGYWIHKEFINQGIATEASAALTRVGFEIDGLDRIEIHCDPANIRSAAVPAKLGYQHEATLRGRLRSSDGDSRDVMIWTLFKEEYPGSPASNAEIEAFDIIGKRIL